MKPKVLLVYNELDATEPYIEALNQAGLEAKLVPASEDVSIESADGLLLMGGCDVDPSLFGEGRHPETEESDILRDRTESQLIAQALAHDVPVFGVCRGLQMLNVQGGGTLHQHLEGTRHRVRTPDKSQPAHEVNIVPGTRLASIAGERTRWNVNSRHHQAIRNLAPGWKVSAIDAEDGTVEAIEMPGKRFAIAVQWHPENQAAVHPEQAALFAAFAEACKEAQKSY